MKIYRTKRKPSNVTASKKAVRSSNRRVKASTTDDFVFYYNGDCMYTGNGSGFANVIERLCKNEKVNTAFQKWCNQFGDPFDFDGTAKDTAIVFAWLVEQEQADTTDFYLEGNVAGNRFECFPASQVAESTRITNRNVVKQQKSIRASQARSSKKRRNILAGGVYPEYISDLDDCAEDIESVLYNLTGIRFSVDADSIEYINDATHGASFRFDASYYSNTLAEYLPYTDNSTPIITKMIQDDSVTENSESAMSIEDPDDFRHGYYNGLSFDIDVDDSYSVDFDEYEKELDIVETKILKKIYDGRESLRETIAQYASEDDEY